MHRAGPRFALSYVLRSLLFVTGVGCSSYQPDLEMGTDAWRQSMRVLVQVCVRNDPNRAFLLISQVNRFGDNGELRFVGSSSGKLIGTSPSAQPVFELFTYQRHIDLVAILVRDGKIEYIYDAAKAKPIRDHWTDWQSPWSQNHEQEMVSHKLAREEDFKVSRANVDAPRVRYRLVRTRDWAVPRANDDRPNC